MRVIAEVLRLAGYYDQLKSRWVGVHGGSDGVVAALGGHTHRIPKL